MLIPDANTCFNEARMLDSTHELATSSSILSAITDVRSWSGPHSVISYVGCQRLTQQNCLN